MILVFGLLAGVSYWMWDSQAEPDEHLLLEPRFTPDHIVDANRSILAPTNDHTVRAPQLKYYPYLLIDIEKPQGSSAMLLWSLDDGEMVIDTETWEKSDGFEECIQADATPEDFQVIAALLKNKGRATSEELTQAIPNKAWIQSAYKKKLILKRGFGFRLGIHSPRLNVQPETKISQWLSTKSSQHLQRVPPKYTSDQIQKVARAAFGSELGISNVRPVYLPVITVEVEHSTGTVITSYWNGLNGKRLDLGYLGKR